MLELILTIIKIEYANQLPMLVCLTMGVRAYMWTGSKQNFAFAVFNAICYYEHFDNDAPICIGEKVILLKHNNTRNGNNNRATHSFQ